jgi:hypothetical protein
LVRKQPPRQDGFSQPRLRLSRCASCGGAVQNAGLESSLWDTSGTHVALTANKNPRFTGVLEADEGTRTLDLLHGKCERPFASVRAGSLKPADCRVSRPSERTRPNPSERRNLAILATPAKASGHGPHVGDVLLNRHREHRRALFLIRSDPKRTLLRCVGEHQRLNARASQFARARERSSNLPTVSTAVRSHSSVRIRDRRCSRVY